MVLRWVNKTELQEHSAEGCFSWSCRSGQAPGGAGCFVRNADVRWSEHRRPTPDASDVNFQFDTTRSQWDKDLFLEPGATFSPSPKPKPSSRCRTPNNKVEGAGRLKPETYKLPSSRARPVLVCCRCHPMVHVCLTSEHVIFGK